MRRTMNAYGRYGRRHSSGGERWKRDEDEWQRNLADYRAVTDPLKAGLVRFDGGGLELVRRGLSVPTSSEIVASLSDPRKGNEPVSHFRHYPGFGYGEDGGLGVVYYVDPMIVPPPPPPPEPRRRRSQMREGADKQRWDELHAAHSKANEATKEYERQLRGRYGYEGQWRSWITKTERAKLESLENRAGKVGDKIFDLLMRVSPRGEAWYSGAPSWWIREKLTWEDAIRPTNEPLSVVVPGAYGYPDGYVKESTMNHDEDAYDAGVQYADNQIDGAHFQDWVRAQLIEASRMDPSQVLPLKTKADARVIARNMLQQLEEDAGRDYIGRDSGDPHAFAKGFRERLHDPAMRDWVATELLEINSELRGGEVEEAPATRNTFRVIRKGWGASQIVGNFRSRAEAERERDELNRQALKDFQEGRITYDVPEFFVEAIDDDYSDLPLRANETTTGGSADFEGLLRRYADIGDRQLRVRHEHRLGGPSHYYESVYVNFYNLPQGVGGAGGGAEAENNRLSFWIHGFNGSDPHAPPPSGKVKIEHSTSAFSREYNLRGKTGTPEAIARYLGEYLTKFVREVPPKFTHTKGYGTVGETPHETVQGSPADVLATLQPGDLVTVESPELTRPRKLVVTNLSSYSGTYAASVSSGHVRPGHRGGGSIYTHSNDDNVYYQATLQQQTVRVSRLTRTAAAMAESQPVDDPFYIIQGLYFGPDAYSAGGSFGFDEEDIAIAEAKKLARDPTFEGDYVRIITRDGELVWDSRRVRKAGMDEAPRMGWLVESWDKSALVRSFTAPTQALAMDIARKEAALGVTAEVSEIRPEGDYLIGVFSPGSKKMDRV